MALLEQSLADTSHLFNEQLAHNQQQRRELQYLYSILPQGGAWKYEVRPDAQHRLLLIRSLLDKYGLALAIHHPAAQCEIAAVYARAVGDTLYMDDMVIDFVACDDSLGKLLVQELSLHGRGMRLQRIEGRFGHKNPAVLEEQARFYVQAGFEVQLAPGLPMGKLYYTIAPKTLPDEAG